MNVSNLNRFETPTYAENFLDQQCVSQWDYSVSSNLHTLASSEQKRYTSPDRAHTLSARFKKEMRHLVVN